jgi:hypothetical protein
MSDYIPVPVEAAKSIAERFKQKAVVVLAWDDGRELMHTTTYGASAIDKVVAAGIGERCAAAIGCDLGRVQSFEDFRADFDPARLREAEEILASIGDGSSVISSRDMRRIDLFRRGGRR